jgi:hypothetical protein
MVPTDWALHLQPTPPRPRGKRKTSGQREATRPRAATTAPAGLRIVPFRGSEGSNLFPQGGIGIKSDPSAAIWERI